MKECIYKGLKVQHHSPQNFRRKHVGRVVA
jgi:hypothetical protein